MENEQYRVIRVMLADTGGNNFLEDKIAEELNNQFSDGYSFYSMEKHPKESAFFLVFKLISKDGGL